MDSDVAGSVAKNTAIQFGQQLVTWASSFALMLFLPRYLGPVRYGRIYLAEMIAAIFLVLISYDGRFSIARRVSRNRDRAGEILVNSISFRVILWIASLAGMIIFSFVAGYPTPVRIIIVIFGIEMVWITARTVYSGVFLGFEITKYTAIGAISGRLFVSIVGISALLLGGDEITIAIVMVLGTLLNFLLCRHYLKRIVASLPRVNWGITWELVKEGFPFLLWTIFGVVYYRIDSVMLSLMTTEKVVGWYGAAYKFYDVLAFFPSILSLALLPVLSKLYGKEDRMLARTTQKSLNVILLAGIPISILVFMFSQNIILFIFGAEGYGPSVLNLKLFSVGLLLLYVDMALGTALVACEKQQKLAWIAFAAVILNVGLNYVMIPRAQAMAGNGGIGAAIATTVTEFFILLSSMVILPRSIFDEGDPRVIYKSIGSGVVMIASLLVLETVAGSLYWMIPAFAASLIYLGTLLLLRTFSSAELSFIRQFLTLKNFRDMLTTPRGAGK